VIDSFLRRKKKKKEIYNNNLPHTCVDRQHAFIPFLVQGHRRNQLALRWHGSKLWSAEGTPHEAETFFQSKACWHCSTEVDLRERESERESNKDVSSMMMERIV
jgi:hypothetical protein